MDSLKKYSDRSWWGWGWGGSVPEDCHNVAIQTDAAAVCSEHEDVSSSQGGCVHPHQVLVDTELLSLLLSPGRKHACRGNRKCTLCVSKKKPVKSCPALGWGKTETQREDLQVFQGGESAIVVSGGRKQQARV